MLNHSDSVYSNNCFISSPPRLQSKKVSIEDNIDHQGLQNDQTNISSVTSPKNPTLKRIRKRKPNLKRTRKRKPNHVECDQPGCGYFGKPETVRKHRKKQHPLASRLCQSKKKDK